MIRLVNGPEAFTPDGEFILGETDVRGFWVAAGFCAHGLAGAGGMGKLVAEWIVEGLPSLDVWEMDSRRFGRHYASRDYTLARTVEVYSTYYDVKYPGHERQAGRPLRLSPTYPRLQELGAAFGEKSGLGAAELVRAERGRAATSRCARAAGPGGSGRPRSAPSTGPTREAAALFDETSFAKIEVSGAGAADFLERLCDNRVARDVGAITYTSMLNERGGIECDFTVTRLAEDRFRIVTGTAFGRHDLAWIRSHAPEDGSVAVEDVTSALRLPRHLGAERPGHPPAARRRETSRTKTSRTCGRASSRSARSPASRSASPTSASSAGSSTARWSSVSSSGTRSGRPARSTASSPGGYKAIDSCRLEKGYRVWGADITPEDTPYEAGLGFAVKLDKEDFIGRDALVGRGRRLERKLVCLVLETRARSRSAPSRCGSTAGSSGASRAAATATRSSARSPTRTCLRTWPRSAAGRSRDLRRVPSPAKWRPSRSTTPRERAQSVLDSRSTNASK